MKSFKEEFSQALAALKHLALYLEETPNNGVLLRRRISEHL